ncbi:hypothetical protein HYALB_00003428 [Hymenoscyphus albidus]|uniref:Uncharacterized protein n=1 Tax=Hymenoscyphus albidus TaxID=595503 RepID=A0A9N9LAM3_9HELO|nr:hypothetical protein HYALB_00003428 [Hymenoscyphus albidus]
MLYFKVTSGSFAVDVAAYIITSVCTLLLATRIFTEARFWLRSRGAAGRFQGREPLTLPYTIPWLGGATRMMGGHSVYKYAKSMSPLGRPVKLRVGSLNMYILFGPKNMKAFFRNSKSVSKDASSIMSFKNTFKPAKDVQIFKDDQSGYGATSLTGGKNETRIWKRTHDLGNAALANGPDVNLLTSRFM